MHDHIWVNGAVADIHFFAIAVHDHGAHAGGHAQAFAVDDQAGIAVTTVDDDGINRGFGGFDRGGFWRAGGGSRPGGYGGNLFLFVLFEKGRLNHRREAIGTVHAQTHIHFDAAIREVTGIANLSTFDQGGHLDLDGVTFGDKVFDDRLGVNTHAIDQLSHLAVAIGHGGPAGHQAFLGGAAFAGRRT